jgi:hypothetical protein
MSALTGFPVVDPAKDESGSIGGLSAPAAIAPAAATEQQNNQDNDENCG